MPSKPAGMMRHIAAFIAAVLFAFPLYVMLASSLQPAGTPPSAAWGALPPGWHWENYQRLFELVPMGLYLRNSTIVAAVAVPLTSLVASMAGFAITQMPNKARRTLVYASLGLLILPAASVWIFRFQILSWLGLIDSLWALILPAFAGSSPLYILLYYWSFRRIPFELFEAAQLDGATAFACWRKIAMPLSRPATMGVILLSFILYWGDFVSPILYIYRPRWYTIPVGVQIVKQLDATNIPLLLAASTIMSLPVIMLFLGLQRLFTAGISPRNPISH